MAEKKSQSVKVSCLTAAVHNKNLEEIKRIFADKEAPTYLGSVLATACLCGGP